MLKKIKLFLCLPFMLCFQSCFLISIIEQTTIQENPPLLKPYEYLSGLKRSHQS